MCISSLQYLVKGTVFTPETGVGPPPPPPGIATLAYDSCFELYEIPDEEGPDKMPH